MIADFVMEMGLDDGIPTYSGGLGILAGDFASSFADLGVPAIFVTLLYRKGYMIQKLDATQGQLDYDVDFEPQRFLTHLEKQVEIEVAGRMLKVDAWEYRLKGKCDVPVLFLDTHVEGNDDESRAITDRLYGGDSWRRLTQEMVLGIAGYRMLKALGYDVDIYQLNESHSAFLTLELMKEYGDPATVRKKCVFTTHTPVAAGYDSFPILMVRRAFDHYDWIDWGAESQNDMVDLSRIALKYSGITNGVSLKHRYVSQRILNHPEIEYVTNGVYHRRWVHDALKKLFDAHLPGWEETPSLLRGAFNLPTDELARAHTSAKLEMMELLKQRTGTTLKEDVLTIGFAKRVTAYKRNNLILDNPDRLINIANEHGPIQVVLAGKAHPRDDIGKAIIRYILDKGEYIKGKTDKLRIVYLDNYDIKSAKALVSGCDLWLNNPRRPLEASGTSGMKAAMNGVLNFSIYDGWWLEGCIEGVNGWGIGKKASWREFGESSDSEDLEDLYSKLSYLVLPAYYRDHRERWWSLARNSIATVGPFFNSYRMVEEYVARVYSRMGTGIARAPTTPTATHPTAAPFT